MQHHFESPIEENMGKILDSLNIQYETQVELGWHSIGSSCLSRFHCEWKEDDEDVAHCTRDNDERCRFYRDSWRNLYRLDFAIRLGTTQIAIECDGWDYHKTSHLQIQRDIERDKWLKVNGWIVKHYDGTFIRRHPGKIKREIQELIVSLSGANLSQSTMF